MRAVTATLDLSTSPEVIRLLGTQCITDEFRKFSTCIGMAAGALLYSLVLFIFPLAGIVIARVVFA